MSKDKVRVAFMVRTPDAILNHKSVSKSVSTQLCTVSTYLGELGKYGCELQAMSLVAASIKCIHMLAVTTMHLFQVTTSSKLELQWPLSH